MLKPCMHTAKTSPLFSCLVFVFLIQPRNRSLKMVTVDEEYVDQIEKARRHLRGLIASLNCAPLMLRLAMHDAGTFDPESIVRGGPNGSIRSEIEWSHRLNQGLKEAVDLCEPVKQKYNRITHADIYQLAGIVAVEITGGPAIEFLPGRRDSLFVPEEGRLPDDTQEAWQLRKIFNRMGLNDRDIVALRGGYKGVARGNEGLASETDDLTFDNSYFKELLLSATTLAKIRKADLALLYDQTFRTYVNLYARDEDRFFADYAAAHKKMTMLGFVPRFNIVRKPASSDHGGLLGAVGIVVATTMVIIGFLLSESRKPVKPKKLKKRSSPPEKLGS